MKEKSVSVEVLSKAVSSSYSRNELKVLFAISANCATSGSLPSQCSLRGIGRSCLGRMRESHHHIHQDAHKIDKW